jgi:predicted deacylase
LKSYELDLVIDLHTDSGEAYPYVLLDRSIVLNSSLAKKIWILGEESRMFSIWEYPLRRYRQFNLQNSLAGTVLNQLKIPSLTIEVGPRRHIRASSVELAFKSIQNILVSLGMLDKSKCEDLGLRVPYGIWRRETGPRSSEKGLIFPLVEVGIRLAKSDPIANIINEEGVIQEKIYAPEPCVVLSYPDIGYIQARQPVCTLAVLEFEEI